ncbi:hypothetical protein EXS57_03345 [Candidatus Kaiserbacteria bacterium]|nr:hypothetical protein [Candidatus Kaiserbacteria bacterium]
MKREVIVVNNFYENPEDVVRYAQGLQYYNPWANSEIGSSMPDDMARAKWHSSFFKKAKDCPFKSSKAFITALEDITGEDIDLDHWNRDFPENPDDGTVLSPRPDLIDAGKPPTFQNLLTDFTSCRWNCAFQAKYKETPLGTGVHNHVQDTWNSVGANGWVGLIYLNKGAPRDSGLRTFNNKHGNEFEWMTPANRWELLDNYANIYNRLILVRGWMPHAGGSGFGNTIMDGRFFQTLFFKTKNIREIDTCSVDLPV